MRALRTATSLITLAALLLAPAPAASAHPMGNFSTNRYSRIELSAGQIDLLYVVDVAEIPTVQEMARLDPDGDGQVGDDEKGTYLSRTADQLARGLDLRIDQTALPLTLTSSDLAVQPGQAGLPTLRITLTLSASIAPQSERPTTLSYRDGNFASRIGWSEIVLRADGGVDLLESTVPSTDLSNELRTYPKDLINSPPDRREARATFRTVASGVSRDSTPASRASTGLPALMTYPLQHLESLLSSLVQGIAAPVGRGSPSLSSAAAAPAPGPTGVALALLLAMVWGATHALSPGHGKTVVAAYLVGARGTARHALFLGLTVTATHTLGVYALGLVTLFAARFILPESLYPWLALFSGLAVFGVGGSLALNRARGFRTGDRSPEHQHAGDHDRGHYLERHGHDHDHPHSHLPPDAGGSTVTWRSLLALGVAGGLLPCPSALVLLLGAIALHQVAFGLVLVLAFSLGLTLVLTGMGLVLVYARQFVSRRRGPRVRLAGPLLRVAPIGSALIISLLGLAMTLQALGQTGLLRL